MFVVSSVLFLVVIGMKYIHWDNGSYKYYIFWSGVRSSWNSTNLVYSPVLGVLYTDDMGVHWHHLAFSSHVKESCYFCVCRCFEEDPCGKGGHASPVCRRREEVAEVCTVPARWHRPETHKQASSRIHVSQVSCWHRGWQSQSCQPRAKRQINKPQAEYMRLKFPTQTPEPKDLKIF